MITLRGETHVEDTVTVLARIEDVDGDPITIASIAEAAYSVYLLDDRDPTSRTAVTGHSDVEITPDEVIYDALQTGDAWTVDATGYNFRHTIDVSAVAAFALAGRMYLVRYTLTPTSGQPIIVEARIFVR